MINSWGVTNFKTAQSVTPLQLAPITVFAGANNSGKSTLIQSILMIAQTIQSRFSASPIVLNGHIIRLGKFSDILSRGADANPISITFTLIPTVNIETRRHYSDPEKEALKSVNCELSFSASGPAPDEENLQLHPRLESCRLTATIKAEGDEESRQETVSFKRASRSIEERLYELQIDKATIAPWLKSALGYELVNPMKSPKSRLRRGQTTGKVPAVLLSDFLPHAYLNVFDEVDREARRVLRRFLEPQNTPTARSEESASLAPQAQGMLVSILKEYAGSMKAEENDRFQSAINQLETGFSFSGFRRCIMALDFKRRRTFADAVAEQEVKIVAAIMAQRSPTFSAEPLDLSGEIDASVDYIREYFGRRLKYLGPLRDEPKAAYPLSRTADIGDIGFAGENTAAVLNSYRNAKVRYIPASAFELPGALLEPIEGTLTAAIQDWMTFMGVAQRANTKELGTLGHELKVSTDGGSCLDDLTHVGVGVSQVLPILVLSLLAGEGSTLVFEQPELHLHPRVQTRLADFFISMASLGKQCILETHSEYLINRLRYRAAIEQNGFVSGNTVIYFVERMKGQSIYRPIKINEFGVINEWPTGFFDEAESQSLEILQAAMKKRERKRD